MSKIQWLNDNKEYVISLYKELNNVWEVGKVISIGGGQVHDFLRRERIINSMNYFTDNDYEFLKINYTKYRDDGNLKELAFIMNRTTAFLSRKAKELNLTDKTSKPFMKKFGRAISENTKRYIKLNGHPKGMLGKHHSDEFKKEMSKRVKDEWADKTSIFNSEEFRQRKSDNMAKLQAKGVLNNQYSRTKNGVVNVNGREIFFRSSWECNIAFYLDFLKSKNEITEWEYEPDVFWFEKIKRGVRSYKPDFKITRNDSTQYYIEVKGWMDKKSVTKMKRMKIYYPNIPIELLDQKRYKEIKKLSSIIKGWGALENGNIVEFKKCSIEGCENKSHSKEVCRKHYFKLYKK